MEFDHNHFLTEAQLAQLLEHANAFASLAGREPDRAGILEYFADYAATAAEEDDGKADALYRRLCQDLNLTPLE